jgi:hypothetical protein
LIIVDLVTTIYEVLNLCKSCDLLTLVGLVTTTCEVLINVGLVTTTCEVLINVVLSSPKVKF